MSAVRISPTIDTRAQCRIITPDGSPPCTRLGRAEAAVARFPARSMATPVEADAGDLS